jgi:hypothetical protein
MKSSSSRFSRTGIILLASATLCLAQTSGHNNSPEPYGSVHNNSQTVRAPQSVRPGSLNYVEGQVSSNGETLTPESVGQFSLQPGQSIETGNGYVEILLTPGAFLRIGPNSEASMPSAGLSDTRVNLLHGTAMVEADQIIEGTRLEVGVDNDTAGVTKKGLYSFDGNQQAIRVLDGKLKVTSSARSRDIGKGDQILLADGDELKKTDFSVSQAKHDPLYVWSEARSRDESGRNMQAAQDYNAYVGAGSGWYWDPYSRYYGFWPTSGYLYSPFGFGFYGYPGYHAGFYPGYYRGYGYRGYHGYHGGRAAGVRGYSGFRGNSVGGSHGGGRGGRR